LYGPVLLDQFTHGLLHLKGNLVGHICFQNDRVELSKEFGPSILKIRLVVAEIFEIIKILDF
jgi:hypothetical protein